jgi:hypothetical protein
VTAIEDIAAERQRQIEVEGWTPEHDDKHDNEELRFAAACYALGTPDISFEYTHGAPNRNGTLSTLRGIATRTIWPWEREWWRPGKRRRDLVKAGALIVAEIERLDRLEASRDLR